MSLKRCPRCGTPVRIFKNGSCEVALEPRLDSGPSPTGLPAGVLWVAHSVIRCEFAGLIAANFERG